MTAVVALYNYTKRRKEDLSFKKNEELIVLTKLNDAAWACARNNNDEVGVIPLNFVEPKCDPPWLHKNINRTEAESLLQDYPIGTFLVRGSGQFVGDFTLSLVSYEKSENSTQSPVQHYHILSIHHQADGKSEKFFSLDNEEVFPSLRKLIGFYLENSHGLSTKLVSAVPVPRSKHLALLREHNYWIQSDQLFLGQKLGHGEFGEVLKGTYLNRDVAVKGYKASAKYQLVDEACIMMMLKHENLVSLVGVTEDANGTYLVSEFLTNGSLLCFLRSRGRALIGPSMLLSFAIDTAKALVYMEEHGFLHCDIAARNVLLSDASPIPVAKLADFGLARRLESTGPTDIANILPLLESEEKVNLNLDTIPLQTSTPVSNDWVSRIPIKWTAPESIRSRVFSHKSDVWSFGIMLWELFSYGRLPYTRLMTNQVLHFLEQGKRLSPPEDCPSDVYSLMCEQWAADPAARPRFSKCLATLRDIHAQLTSPTAKMRHKGHSFPALPDQLRFAKPLMASISPPLRKSFLGCQKSKACVSGDEVYDSISDDLNSSN